MSQYQGSSARIVKETEADTSLQQANPLSDHIINADIQVRTIAKLPQDAGPPIPTGVPSQPSSIGPRDDAEKQRAANMQMWWDEAIAKNLNLPEGYHNISVLIIKWADELDELKTKEEAQELEQVFRNRFHYHTETVELNMKTKPQLQLNRCVSTFAEEHNGPNNLLIIYYTGHGVFREDDKYLQLTACINPGKGKGLYKDAHANWNKAEDILKADDIDADILTILDTCYASNIAKSAKQSTRKFELLSACPFDQTTAAPGPESFTRALIDNLEDLAREYGDRPFTTFHLNQRICMEKMRLDTPSLLWYRLPNDQHILLAPLKRGTGSVKPKAIARAPRGYLTLRFALRDEELNKEQIEVLTRNLSRAFENKRMIGLKKVDWLGIEPAPISYFERATLAVSAVKQWRKVVAQKRAEREMADGMDVDIDHRSPLLSPTRKRSGDALDDLQGTKRRITETSQPPLSPVSNSSRNHEER